MTETHARADKYGKNLTCAGEWEAHIDTQAGFAQLWSKTENGTIDLPSPGSIDQARAVLKVVRDELAELIGEAPGHLPLSPKEMLAAFYAQTIDEDLDMKGEEIEGAEHAREWARKNGLDELGVIAKYHLGQELLKRYALWFSRRYSFNGPAPNLPKGCTDHAAMVSGKIGAETAFRMMCFIPLQEEAV